MKTNLLKCILISFIMFMMLTQVNSQNIVKVSCEQLCNKLINPPSSVDEALSKCVVIENKLTAENTYKPQSDELKSYVQAGTAPSEATKKRMEQSKQMGEQMQRDNFQNMSDEDKLRYTRKNMAGKEGIPSQATMDFGEKMKDPAFKAKFEKMTPEEKIAEMRKSGMLQQQDNAVTRDEGVQKSQDQFAAKMQDPAFRAEWKKKTPEEKDAYMKQMMKDNKVNTAKIARESAKEGVKVPEPMVLTDVMQAAIRLQQESNSFIQSHSERARKAKEEAEAKHIIINAEAKNEIQKVPVVKGGENTQRDPAKVKSIQSITMNKHMAQAREDLVKQQSMWMNDKIQYENMIRQFDDGLAKVHYGDDVKNPAERQQFPTLAAYQSTTIINILNFLAESQDITESAADWMNKNKQFEAGQYLPVLDSGD